MGVIVSRPVGCTEFSVIKFKSLCSGHGVCVLEQNGTQIQQPNVPSSKCVCDHGWSGYNDLVSMSNHDCSINSITITIIWSLVFISALLSSIYIIHKLVHSLIRYYALIKKHGDIHGVGRGHFGSEAGGYSHSEGSQANSPQTLLPRRLSTPTTPVGTHQSLLPRRLSTPIMTPSGTPILGSSQLLLPTPTGTPGDTPSATPILGPSDSPQLTTTPPTPTTTTTTMTATTQHHHHRARDFRYTTTRSIYSWRSFLKWRVVEVSLLSLPSTLTLTCMGIARLVHPEAAIGVSLPMTLCFIFSGVMFWIAYRNTSMSWLRIRRKVIRFTAEDQKRAEAAIIRLQRLLRFANIPELIEIICFILLVYQQQSANIILFISYHANFVNILLSCVAFIQAARSMETVLNQGVEDLKGHQRESREKAIKRLHTLIVEETQMLKGFLPFPLVMAWWPWLRSVNAYCWFQLIFTSISLVQRIRLLHPPSLANKKRKDHEGRARNQTLSSHQHSPPHSPRHHHHTKPVLHVADTGLFNRDSGGSSSRAFSRRNSADEGTPNENDILIVSTNPNPVSFDISIVEQETSGLRLSEESRIELMELPDRTPKKSGTLSTFPSPSKQLHAIRDSDEIESPSMYRDEPSLLPIRPSGSSSQLNLLASAQQDEPSTLKPLYSSNSSSQLLPPPSQTGAIPRTESVSPPLTPSSSAQTQSSSAQDKPIFNPFQ